MPMKITKNKVDTREFVPSCELEKDEVTQEYLTPEDQRVVFKYRDLSPSEQLEVSDLLYGMSAESTGRADMLRPAHMALEVTMRRLVGWKNITDEDGNKIDFPTSKAQLKEILNMLDYDTFVEIVAKIGMP